MKRLLITLAVLTLSAAVCAAVPEAAANLQKNTLPLREGFMFSGIDGTLTKAQTGEKWFFAADVDMTDTRATLKAGRKIEMLPSAALERITADTRQTVLNIKLWARVTRYCNRNMLIDKLPSRKFINRKLENKTLLDSKFLSEHLYNKNYLFAIYFIPMTDSPQQPPDESTEDDNNKTNETDTESIIPEDVLKQLNPKKVVNLAKLTEALETETDVMLADRTGFVSIDDDEKVFMIDGLGRNVDDLSFKLLSCEALEWTEKSLVDSPIVRQRFRVSGIITTYNRQHYMLLQRATRTYSHGNFAR